MNFYLLGLGSNIEPRKHLEAALEALGRVGSITAASPILTTPPVGETFQQPFCNQLLVLQSHLPAPLLKQKLLAIETALGREPKSPARALKDRTIDIDILGQAASTHDCRQLHPEESYFRRVAVAWQQQTDHQSVNV